MRKNFKKLILLFFLINVILLSNYAITLDDIDIKVINNTFRVDSSQKVAKYEITIKKPGKYKIDWSAFGFDWFVETIPESVKFYAFEVDDSFSFTINAYLVKSLEPQMYSYAIEIRDLEDNSLAYLPLKAIILPKIVEVNKSYPLVVKVDSNLLTEEVLPGGIVKLDVFIENKNPRDIGDVKVTIDSQLFHKEVTYVLKPRTKDAPISDYKKYEIFEFTIPDKILPQEVPVHVRIKYENNTFEKSFNFKILSVKKAYSTIVPSYKFWFKKLPVVKKLTISLINKGNVEKHFYHEIHLGFLDRFISTNISTINKKLVIINETLSPYSTKEYYLTIDYRPLVISSIAFILAIITIIILYYLTRSPIVFRKELEKHYFKSGNLYLVMNLIIKNRSRRVLNNITIKEYLPSAAQPVIDELYLVPKTSKTRRGLLLKWEIDKLDPKDERLIIYKIKFRLKIFGEIRFSPTELYYTKNNKKYKIISNELRIKI